ncbi:hypothetical protein BS47DRAFT_1490546 [Hydnum rufescens UP504]|uniref:Uncharacterized protein n=1 Tax=Hydnum rufescens UP504 TaxID=1448309 RepID=A0A9P6DEB5_9AGAM|nr:hypothetical protein BS47DRAFT_1490546 [Hydnum rufescens UP504]
MAHRSTSNRYPVRSLMPNAVVWLDQLWWSKEFYGLSMAETQSHSSAVCLTATSNPFLAWWHHPDTPAPRAPTRAVFAKGGRDEWFNISIPNSDNQIRRPQNRSAKLLGEMITNVLQSGVGNILTSCAPNTSMFGRNHSPMQHEIPAVIGATESCRDMNASVPRCPSRCSELCAWKFFPSFGKTTLERKKLITARFDYRSERRGARCRPLGDDDGPQLVTGFHDFTGDYTIRVRCEWRNKNEKIDNDGTERQVEAAESRTMQHALMRRSLFIKDGIIRLKLRLLSLLSNSSARVTSTRNFSGRMVVKIVFYKRLRVTIDLRQSLAAFEAQNNSEYDFHSMIQIHAFSPLPTKEDGPAHRAVAKDGLSSPNTRGAGNDKATRAASTERPDSFHCEGGWTEPKGMSYLYKITSEAR